MYFQYCFIPSVKKPVEEMDPQPFLSKNHYYPSKSDLQARKRRARINWDSFFLLVRDNQIQTVQQLYELAYSFEDVEQSDFTQFLAKRKDLQADLNVINSVACGSDVTVPVAPDRFLLMKKAYNSRCCCDGQLAKFQFDALKRNDVSVPEYCESISNALLYGAMKDNNIGLVGPSNTGKTSMLKPIEEIFGIDNVFTSPQAGCSFPLLSLPGKSVVLLNDYRSNTVPWQDALIWFEGLRFIIARPRNLTKSDVLYVEQAPIFMTSGDVLEGRNRSQTEMMSNRFKYFHFTRTVTNRKARVPSCARCYLRFLEQYSTDLSLFEKIKSYTAPVPKSRPPGMSAGMYRKIKNARNKRIKKNSKKKNGDEGEKK